jgi:methylase of polypeptide subunit release factors
MLPRADDRETLAELREHLDAAAYTTESIVDLLGSGRISFAPADVALHLRRLDAGERLPALVKLFFVGATLTTGEALAAFDDTTLRRLEGSGWIQGAGGDVRAGLKLVPHGDLLVASDRDADGPTGAEWVAGIHPPSATLAKLTIRRPVERVLDVATGNGIQAMLASRHASTVVASDVNPRALAVAELNARLNGIDNIEFRQGSFFEPTAGERFELITCNPPYVISPESSYAYRDSGLPGDTVSRQVVQDAPRHLDEGGFAHVLVSWGHPPDDPWSPLEGWIAESGCDAWLLHFGSDDPITHAGEWLGPIAARDPDAYPESLDRWLRYLDGLGIEAIAHGAVVLRRRSTARNWVRKDVVALDRLEQASDHVLRVFSSQDYLESLGDDRRMLDDRFHVVDRHHLDQRLVCRGGETALERTTLALDEGFGFRIAVDDHTARLLPFLDGTRTLREALARVRGTADADFERAALPAVRRLVELGFVVPA